MFTTIVMVLVIVWAAKTIMSELDVKGMLERKEKRKLKDE